VSDLAAEAVAPRLAALPTEDEVAWALGVLARETDPEEPLVVELTFSDPEGDDA